MPPRGGIDELRGQRGDAAQPLQEIERGALGLEQRMRVAAHVRDDFARLDARAIAPSHLEHRLRIELAKRFGGDVDAGDDEIGFRDDRAARAGALRDRRGAGRVAAAAILGERLANQVAIRLGRDGLQP